VSLSPLLLLAMLTRGGGMGLAGCLMGLVVLFALVIVLAILLNYAAAVILVLLVFSAACLLYWQHVEKQADAEAARIIGDSDLVLAALARSAEGVPTQSASLDKFAALHLGSASGYGLQDIVGALKSGADPAGGIGWRHRLLRSHPTAVERMAHIVRIFDSRIA
jgi:Zn-dependent protease with chaperone function